jgi:hypothetical protein
MCVNIEALPSLGTGCGSTQVRNGGVKNALHCKLEKQPNNVKPTHLCCDTVKEVVVYNRPTLSPGSDRQEVTMPALAEVMSTIASNPDPRGCDLPTCPVCADSMVAAEASAYLSDNVISYLWTCDTCGYGFVTKHSLKRFACN